MGKIVQTAGRNALGEFAPQFAHFNKDIAYLEEMYVPHPVEGAVKENSKPGVILVGEKK